MRRRSISRAAVSLAVLGASLAPFWAGSYLLHVWIVTCLFIVIASAWNLAAMAGQISLGHAGFFGIGAYAAAVLFERWGAGPLWGMAAGGALAAAAAAAVGRVCLRIRGVYFAMPTIAFAEAVKVLVVTTPAVTSGAMGIGLPPLFGGSRPAAYGLVLGLVALTLATDIALRRSRWRYAVAAIREDEDAAGMLGVDPARFKVAALAISAGLTGMAGGFYAHYISFVEPHVVFGLQISVESQIMPIVGGVYTLWGPVLGALILVPAKQYMAYRLGASELYLVGYAAVFVVILLVLPRGILPSLGDAYERWRYRGTRVAPQPEEVPVA